MITSILNLFNACIDGELIRFTGGVKRIGRSSASAITSGCDGLGGSHAIALAEASAGIGGVGVGDVPVWPIDRASPSRKWVIMTGLPRSVRYSSEEWRGYSLDSAH